MDASPLFRTELAGPCDAAHRAWGLAEGEPVDWVAGIVPCPAERGPRGAWWAGRGSISLIVNTPRETVIGGRREEVEQLVRDLGGRFVPLPLVSTVHCEVARQVEDGVPRAAPARDDAAAGRSVLQRGDGVAPTCPTATRPPRRSSRTLCMGSTSPPRSSVPTPTASASSSRSAPAASCTRMIGKILGDRPHLARPACLAGQDALATLLDLLGHLIAERVPVDLAPLYGRETTVTAAPTRATPSPPGVCSGSRSAADRSRCPRVPRRRSRHPSRRNELLGGATPRPPQTTPASPGQSA